MRLVQLTHAEKGRKVAIVADPQLILLEAIPSKEEQLFKIDFLK